MILAPFRDYVGGHLVTILLVFCLVFSQTGFADITLQQADGETLVIAQAATRVITLAPNLAEIVFAAGAGERLVAVVEYSNFPEQVTEIQRVGNAFRIDLERIVALEPDLVIAWASGNPQTALQKLEQLGFPVLQVEISQPEEIAGTVEMLAHAMGTDDTGQEVARQLREKLANLKQQYTGKTDVSYFYQVAARPLFTVNGQHIISRGLELCGGKNIFSELSSLAPQIDREAVIIADPQTMIAALAPGETTSLDIWRDWPRLQAIESDNLFYLSADEISQATPRFLDSMVLACQFLDQVRKSN